MLFLAIVLASCLNAVKRLTGIFRVSFFMPAVTSLVAYSIIFSTMLMGDGIINQFLAQVGIGAVPWLSNPVWAKAALTIGYDLAVDRLQYGHLSRRYAKYF